jgi:hypothetical protein
MIDGLILTKKIMEVVFSINHDTISVMTAGGLKMKSCIARSNSYLQYFVIEM